MGDILNPGQRSVTDFTVPEFRSIEDIRRFSIKLRSISIRPMELGVSEHLGDAEFDSDRVKRYSKAFGDSLSEAKRRIHRFLREMKPSGSELEELGRTLLIIDDLLGDVSRFDEGNVFEVIRFDPISEFFEERDSKADYMKLGIDRSLAADLIEKRVPVDLAEDYHEVGILVRESSNFLLNAVPARTVQRFLRCFDRAEAFRFRQAIASGSVADAIAKK